MATPVDEVSLWQSDANCKGIDSNLFFSDEKAAKKLCASCPVRSQCLNEALVYNYYGVWGGTTDKERRKIPKNRIEWIRGDYDESGLYNPNLKV